MTTTKKKKRANRRLKAALTLIVGVAVWAEELAKRLTKGEGKPNG